MITVNADNYGDIGPLKQVRVSTSLTDGITLLDGISDTRILAVLSAAANTGITAKIGDQLVFTGGISRYQYRKSGRNEQGETNGFSCRSAARSVFDSECHNPKGEKYEGQTLSSIIQDVLEREGLDAALFAARNASSIIVNSYRMQHGASLGAELQNLAEDYYGVLTDNGSGVLSVYNIEDFEALPEFVIRESETTEISLNFDGDRRYSRYFAISRKDDKSEAIIVEGEREPRTEEETIDMVKQRIEQSGAESQREFETRDQVIVAGQVNRNRVFTFDNDLTDDQIRKALNYATNRSMVLGLSLSVTVGGQLLNVQKGQPVSIESGGTNSIIRLFNIPNSKWVIESIDWEFNAGSGGSSTVLQITPIEQYGAPDLPQEVYQRSVVLEGGEIGDGENDSAGRREAEAVLNKIREAQNESN